MDDSIEKAYFCSRNEFLILLGIAGAGKIYSFELPGRDEVTEEELTLALYQLTRKGFLQMKEQPEPEPAIRRILDKICHARQVLQVIPGRGGAQKICYLSGEQAAVTELGGEGTELRLCLLAEDQLWQQLTAENQVGPVFLETETEGQTLLRHDEAARKEQQLLSSGQLLSGRPLSMLEPLTAVMEQSGVRGAWERFDIKEGKVLERFLFLEGTTIPWILIQTWESCTAVPDSLEARKELRRKIV
ncbi:MAG: hypothetical protein Q4F76_08025 [Lachnospiraceae bacterium]|nr:hypothetical protein [Lachnospiraceae bacterium]